LPCITAQFTSLAFNFMISINSKFGKFNVSPSISNNPGITAGINPQYSIDFAIA